MENVKKKIPGSKIFEVLGNINIFTTDTYGTYGILKRLYSRYYYLINLCTCGLLVCPGFLHRIFEPLKTPFFGLSETLTNF